MPEAVRSTINGWTTLSAYVGAAALQKGAPSGLL